MKKLAYGNGFTYVTLSNVEFIGLTGQTPAEIPDGTDISLVQIKQKLDLFDAKHAELLSLKTLSSQIVSKLNDIGI